MNVRAMRTKRLFLPLLAFGVVAGTCAILAAAGIVINATASLPLGFYRRVNRPVAKGALVLFRLPALAPGAAATRPYARGNLIKPVVASAGDRVSISKTGVVVNGVPLTASAQLDTDLDGQPLPHPFLCDYVLKGDELLTMSSYNPRSFDARYFGPISQFQVQAVLTPVWTWGQVEP